MGSTVKIYSRFNPPPKKGWMPEGESMTQQQFKAECDVNTIMAKYKKTGMLTHLAKHQGRFGDFSSVEDYQTSLHKVMEAEQSFLSLPSELRSRFHNDPAKLIEYLSDEKNLEESYTLGLRVRPPEPPKASESKPE